MLPAFLIENWLPLFFYLAIILLIVLFRRKLTWQGIAGLYKTQIGVKTMKRLSERHAKLFRGLGYVGIGVGFLGMLVIVAVMLQGLWKLVFVPEAPATVGLVVPGFAIPGAGITVPLFTGWIALFIVVVIHEFSHGVVSKSHSIPVKSSGALFVGPLLGAFVEPDEKKLKKAKESAQYSVYAAGPFSNILTALLFALLLSLVLAPVMASMTTPIGVGITSVTEGLPAAQAGLEPGVLITSVAGKPVANTAEFIAALQTVEPGGSITVTDSGGKEYQMTARPSPDDPTQPQFGLMFKTVEQPSVGGTPFSILYAVVGWITKLFTWVVILSLGIGLANLLPLGPVDGGRMLYLLMTRIAGKERGVFYWKQVSKVVGMILIILIIVPILKGVF